MKIPLVRRASRAVAEQRIKGALDGVSGYLAEAPLPVQALAAIVLGSIAGALIAAGVLALVGVWLIRAVR